MDGPRLEETGRGLTVYASGRYLYSNRDPSGRPRRIAEAAPVEERCIYFVPSPLVGYGLENLAGRIPETSVILAVEASQELMSLCASSIVGGLAGHPSVKFFRLSDRPSLHQVLKDLGPWRYRRVRRLDFSAGPSLHTEVYDDLERFLTEDLMVYWKNRHSLGRLGREWIRHSLANLANAASGRQEILAPPPESRPGAAVVIGAGPSLEASIGFLREHRRRLNLIVTDTAAAALVDTGIEPDSVVALETQAWNLLDFHGLQGSGVPIFADITAYPPSLGITGGPVHVFSSDFADLEYLRRLDESNLRSETIPPLGSVGLAALELALRTNSGPILLTGLDFAYAPGKSHARGTSVHRWQLAVSRRTDPVPGWDASMRRPRIHLKDASGGRIGTDAVLASYAASLADRYSDSDRISVLAPGGLDLGLPVISREEAARLVSVSGGEASTGAGAALGREAAAGFLAGEKERLQAVIDAWDAYASEKGPVEAVTASLEGLDEIFCDFPDEPPLPRQDDSFLVRAVARTRRLHRYLERSGV